MNFGKFVLKISKKARLMRNWRIGQAAFNTLYDVRPEIADKLRGTEFDCYYDDSKTSKFFTEVLRRWDR